MPGMMFVPGGPVTARRRRDRASFRTTGSTSSKSPIASSRSLSTLADTPTRSIGTRCSAHGNSSVSFEQAMERLRDSHRTQRPGDVGARKLSRRVRKTIPSAASAGSKPRPMRGLPASRCRRSITGVPRPAWTTSSPTSCGSVSSMRKDRPKSGRARVSAHGAHTTWRGTSRSGPSTNPARPASATSSAVAGTTRRIASASRRRAIRGRGPSRSGCAWSRRRRAAVPTADLSKPIARVEGDPQSLVPVSDEQFELLRGFYAYDRNPLAAKVEAVRRHAAALADGNRQLCGCLRRRAYPGVPVHPEARQTPVSDRGVFPELARPRGIVQRVPRSHVVRFHRAQRAGGVVPGLLRHVRAAQA